MLPPFLLKRVLLDYIRKNEHLFLKKFSIYDTMFSRDFSSAVLFMPRRDFSGLQKGTY